MKTLDILFVAALAMALIVTSLAALPSYGITWDEALGDLFFGHRNLRALLADDASALDFGHRHAVDGDGRTHPDLFLSPLRTRPWEHWPVMATLSAAMCQLFARRLGWMDPVDAHHLAGPIVVALLLPLFYTAARSAWGRIPAMLCSILLLLHPRLLAATWTDLKDIGTAVFITVAVLALWSASVRRSALLVGLAGLAIGLALGTKANVLFLPLPIAAYALLTYRSWRPPSARMCAAFAAIPAIAFAVVWLAWPWLREAPIARMTKNLSYVAGRAAAGEVLPNFWPLLTVVASWPVGSLLLVLMGAVAATRSLAQRRATLAGLALLATVFPLARLCAPGVVSFDGYRHAFELVPAAALLAGAGASEVLRRTSKGLAYLLFGLCMVEAAIETVRAQPFGVAHFNPLVGGPWGASRLGFPQVEDYWASSYRRAYTWLNEHAEDRAVVAAGLAEHLLFIEGSVRLRPDIELLRASSPFRPDPGADVLDRFAARNRERPVYLLYIVRDGWTSPLLTAVEHTTPLWHDGPPGVVLVRVVRVAKTPAGDRESP